jgi:poly(A) polymerase
MSLSQLETARGTRAFEEAAKVVARLQDGGHEAYFVGGCVRDLLLGLEAKDYDLATSAKPEDVGRIFPAARGFGQRFGVCIVPMEGSEVEVAAFREDGPYFDHRRPAWVNYAGIEADARRRDFTINALYYDPVADRVVDLVEGLADLGSRLLRVIGDPFERLDEDWLRLLRAVRFAARFGLEFDFLTWDAVRALAPLVTGVSVERRTEEIRLMLMAPNAARALGVLYTSGLWKALWPDLPFSVGRLQKIAAALEADPVHEFIWRSFFADLSPQIIETTMEHLRLTKIEKRSVLEISGL